MGSRERGKANEDTRVNVSFAAGPDLFEACDGGDQVGSGERELSV